MLNWSGSFGHHIKHGFERGLHLRCWITITIKLFNLTILDTAIDNFLILLFLKLNIKLRLFPLNLLEKIRIYICFFVVLSSRLIKFTTLSHCGSIIGVTPIVSHIYLLNWLRTVINFKLPLYFSEIIFYTLRSSHTDLFLADLNRNVFSNSRLNALRCWTQVRLYISAAIRLLSFGWWYRRKY